MQREEISDPLHLARREALNRLLRVAKKHGLGQGRFPPFANLSDCEASLEQVGFEDILPPEGAFECDREISDKLRQIVVILEIAQMYAAGLASIQLSKNHEKLNPKGQSAIILLAGLATDLGSIRILIGSGFDVQARIVTRTYGERLDLLIATQVDRAFATAFVANSDVNDANEFWMREVARSKLVNRVSTRLKRLSPLGKTPIDDEWRARRREMMKWLSMATHPSYVAGWFAILPNLGHDHGGVEWSGENGLFGQHSAVSIATGRAVFSRLLEFMYLIEFREKFFLGREGLAATADMLSLIKRPRNFLWKALSECYFAPNVKFFEAYLATQGLKLTPVAQPPTEGVV